MAFEGRYDHMAGAQAALSHSQLGQGQQTSAASIKKPTIAEAIMKDTSLRLDALEQVVHRVENLADRVVGPTPQDVASERPNFPTHHSGMLSAVTASIGEAEMRLRRALERLEEFI